MDNGKKRKPVVDPAQMRELREKEWEEKLFKEQNKYKCKYFFLLEILYFVGGVFLVFKAINLYIDYLNAPFTFGILLKEKYIFRYIPLGMGVFYLYEFILLKTGYFWYMEKAIEYDCDLIITFYLDSFMARQLFIDNFYLLKKAVYYVIVQFGTDYFFKPEEFVKPVVIFLVALIAELYLLSIPEDEFEKSLKEAVELEYWERLYNGESGDDNSGKDSWQK